MHDRQHLNECSVFNYVFLDKNGKSTFINDYKVDDNGDLKLFINNNPQESDEQPFSIITIPSSDREYTTIKKLR